jgi:hypothetical protein
MSQNRKSILFGLFESMLNQSKFSPNFIHFVFNRIETIHRGVPKKYGTPPTEFMPLSNCPPKLYCFDQFSTWSSSTVVLTPPA